MRRPAPPAEGVGGVAPRRRAPSRPYGPVAWVHNNLGYGGGERVLVEQVRALAPLGVPVDVWAIEAKGPQDLVPDIRAANPHVRDVVPVARAGDLARELRRRRYDALFTCWSTRGYRALERLARVPFARRPVVLETIHERYGWCLRDHKGRRRRHVDFFLATYDFRAAIRAAFGVGDERIAVARPLFPSLLPASPDAVRAAGRALRRRLGIPDGACVVGYAGRFSGNKGLHHVVPALARIAARGADVHVVLAGRLSPPSSSYEARFRGALEEAAGAGAPLSGRLHVVPPTEDQHVVHAATDVCPLLSFMEGYFPLMLVEALAHGAAVVTTDVGGIGSCLSDGVDARVVRKVPDDEDEPTPEVVAAFERALEDVIVDRAARARLGAAGRARVETLVAGNDFHGDTLAAYDRALGLGRRRA